MCVCACAKANRVYSSVCACILAGKVLYVFITMCVSLSPSLSLRVCGCYRNEMAQKEKVSFLSGKAGCILAPNSLPAI